MKKAIFIFGFIFLVQILFAQAPQSFKYQAVIRYSDGAIVQNQMVSLRISLLADSPSGTATYAETHDVTTNQFGNANIDIGEGTPQSGAFNNIDWGEHTYFIQTELDINGNGNYAFIGTSRLQSVPYALYAANAVNVDDDDPDPENELQVLSFSNDTLYLSQSGYVYLGDYMDNTDEQNLDLDGTTLSISNGNSVELGGEVDLDADPTNEIQYLSISNDTIYLTDGGFVVLPEVYYDDINNTPDFTGWDQNVNDDFSGDYNDLENKPQEIHEFDLDAGNNTVYNVHNPENPQDAATKAYVDDLINAIQSIYTMVDFEADDTFINSGDTISFTCLTELEPTGYTWNFGDGATSSNPTPTHVYNADGYYDVSLTIDYNGIAINESKEGYITVATCPSTVSDYDGNTYSTVEIGNQCWMAENVNTTHYADGSEITDGTGMEGDTLHKYYWNYDDDPANADIYGKLYNWTAFMNGASGSQTNPSGVQGICPDGWHVPSDAEFKQLEMALGMSQSQADSIDYRGTNQGSMLANNSNLWDDGGLENDTAFGASGFNLLPAGYRSGTSFYSMNESTYLQSATDQNGSNPLNFWYRRLRYNHAKIERDNNTSKSHGFSVRCVKDVP